MGSPETSAGGAAPDPLPPRSGSRGRDEEAARDYVREYRDRYTRDAIGEALRQAGYDQETITEALADFEVGTGTGRDLRDRATWLLVGTFGLTWLIITWRLVESPDTFIGAFASIASLVLGTLLGVALVPSIWWVRRHRKLAAGVPGAFVTAFIVPFVLWLGITGTCVATTRPFGP